MRMTTLSGEGRLGVWSLVKCANESAGASDWRLDYAAENTSDFGRKSGPNKDGGGGGVPDSRTRYRIL